MNKSAQGVFLCGFAFSPEELTFIFTIFIMVIKECPKGDDVMNKAQFGVIGLAVMGANLSLNLMRHGFSLAVYNLESKVTEAFCRQQAKGQPVIPCETLAELIDHLQPPRRILMMIRAGNPVDSVIHQLLPMLAEGDVLIDGGNSLYTDTERRVALCREKGVHFIGMGVSGGEAGALHGPSLMPGGDEEGWPLAKPFLEAIAAKHGQQPCCTWIGGGGSGHFVKSVHNGIEYGDMQVICEGYAILRQLGGYSCDELADIFARYSAGRCGGYLCEITSRILRVKDQDGEPLIDHILDAAGQKGTGKWTGIAAFELDTPLTVIQESVAQRLISASSQLREAANAAYPFCLPSASTDRVQLVADVEDALYAAKLISYAQGFELLAAADRAFDWRLDLGAIAAVWREGCIIRSPFLDTLMEIFSQSSSPLLLSPFYRSALTSAQEGWRRTVCTAILSGLPVPALSSALSYFDSMRARRLPANLLQAQRDFFGAHTFERTDRPRGEFFHHDWLSDK